ncbi:MAG: DMT family transporter [Reinekea sp.]|jgi:drug/metabolite transporter (DMT)-like permease
MKKIDLFTLVLLSAIWGASFLFMRVASDDFGPWSLVFIRMFSAFLCISPLLFKAGTLRRIARNILPLTILALFNQVLPFTLFAFATLRLEAGFTSLLNATTPIMTAIVGTLLFAAPIYRHQIIGLAFSFFGIFVLSSDKMDFTSGGEGWSIIAGLTACLCYAWSANYTKRFSELSASEMAVGTMFTSSLLLVIPGVLYWPAVMPDGITWLSALLLGAFCTGVAFMLFYRLVRSAGALSSTTVTILVPIFAICWGALLLEETISLRMLVGMVLALAGTAVTIRLVKLPTTAKSLENQH